MASAHEIPPVLYKYLRPERLDVLRNCRIRFSQRDVFEDDHELQPDYEKFGTEEEIRRFIHRQGMQLDPVLVRLFTESPKYQCQTVQVAVRNIRSTREMGIFCLAEVCDCEQMWNEYAAGGGFAVAFDTIHSSFNALKAPGILGRVCYSDAVFESFLGMIEADYMAPLFRKRMKYAFEREWRILRLPKHLERHGDGIFLAPFDPASLSAVIIRPDCVVRRELEEILAGDSRYTHVGLSVQT